MQSVSSQWKWWDLDHCLLLKVVSMHYYLQWAICIKWFLYPWLLCHIHSVLWNRTLGNDVSVFMHPIFLLLLRGGIPVQYAFCSPKKWVYHTLKTIQPITNKSNETHLSQAKYAKYALYLYSKKMKNYSLVHLCHTLGCCRKV